MNEDSRQKALALLKEQIRVQRSRIDPDVLARAAAAAQQSPAAQQPLAAPPADQSAVVSQAAAKPAPWVKNAPATESAATSPQAEQPYDRAAAAKAIELFLMEHSDRRAFQQKLVDFMKKSTQ